MSQDKKNIVLVVMDTARARNFSLYGYDRETAPFLSELSEEAVVFKNAYSQHIWTLPSHLCMFSGKYGYDHGGISENFKLKENPLLSTLNENYVTTAISNNTYISQEFGLDSGFDNFERFLQDFPFKNDKEIWNNFSNRDGNYDSSLRKYIDYGIECLKSSNVKQLINGVYYFLNSKFWIGDSGARQSNKIFRKLWEDKEPNFTFINYIEPHGPYRPKSKFRKEFLPEELSKSEVKKNNTYNAMEVFNEDLKISKEEIEIQKSLYDAEIKYLDSKIREIYDFLDSKDELDNTFLIITSDHGEYFGEHNLYRHNGGIYPEVNSVPLLIRYPDGRSSTIKSPVELKQLKDFIEESANGNNPKIPTKDFTYTEYYRGKHSGMVETIKPEIKEKRPELMDYQVSIQDGLHFLKMTETGKEEFWNIKQNEKIQEETAKREEMREKLEINFGEVLENPNSFLPENKEHVDEEIKKQLEKMGYM